MNRERNTLVGTPTLIAPEAIRLTGDFTVPGETLSVYAAISSYTTAQYFPRVHALSPLVSTAVDMAKSDMGDASEALPAGSVLLAPTDSHAKKFPISQHLDAVIAAATVATVFETAGQHLATLRPRILSVATDAHRFLHGEGDADIDLTLAMYGGIVVATHNKDAPPSLTCPTPPAGLQLVLFHTGEPIRREVVTLAIEQFSRRNPRSFQTILDGMIEQGQRFASELEAGNATAAIASFGRYGHRLSAMAAAASMPITTEGFARAALLAKEIGGAVKHANIHGGDVGIALFATPEAARLFAQACQAPLVALPYTLDREGVRCRTEEEPRDAEAMHTPEPELSAASQEAIVRPSFDDEVTHRETLPLPSLLMNESAENLQMAHASSSGMHPIAQVDEGARIRRKTPSGVGPVELTPEVVDTPAHDHDQVVYPDAIDEMEMKPARKGYLWIPVTLLTLAALALTVWAALPVLRKDDQSTTRTYFISTDVHPDTTLPTQQTGSTGEQAATVPEPAIPPPSTTPPSPTIPKAEVPVPEKPAPAATAVPSPIPPASPEAIPTPPNTKPVPGKKVVHKVAGKPATKSRKTKNDDVDAVLPAAAPPTEPGQAPEKKASIRAGKLSTDDF